MIVETVDPSTGRPLERHETLSRRELRDALERSQRAFREWRRVPVAQRVAPLRRLAALLREGRDEHARLMASEMGKPLAQGRQEVDKCAWGCEHVADQAEGWLADEVVETDAARSFVALRPLGPILAVMPWNFPYWQVLRFAAPALAAGNTALLKHAAATTGCALRLERLFGEAGLPEGAFRTLVVTHDQVAEIIADPIVRGVSLTGSTEAGRTVAPAAGKALKPVVLELGGSDPYVVLADADLATAAETCVAARMVNGGQSCIAAKRFIVVQEVRERFTELVVGRMHGLRMGPPLEEGVDLGPQARHDLRDGVHDQVERSVAAGARLLLGGKLPDGPGAFYPPTVLADVRPGMAAFDEEVFGPVAAICPARDERQAIELANATPFGLGAAVFTQDVERGTRIAADELEAGACFVNAQVRSDPRMPFGGVKDSGLGRELSRHGMLEFVNVKTVWVG